MASPIPPQLEAARAQLDAVLEQVEKRKVDLDTEAWGVVEKAVIKVLGGPFRPDRPEHQVAALGLAAALGNRLMKDHGAFWFPLRESPEGASLGFPDALIMLSPFGAVLDALVAARLEKLDDLSRELRTSLGKVKFGAGQAPARLSPLDYQRLFDPGFVQLVQLDTAKVKAAFGLTPERLAADLRDAISRTGSRLPDDVKRQLEQQLVGAVARLEPGKKLQEQLERAPRVGELVAQLWGSRESTGSAPEEFWQDVVFPLLFIGAPDTFPPLDDEEVQLAKQGVAPLFLYLDVVPFAHPAPEEDGLLGAFPAKSLALLDPAFEAAGQAVRLVQVGTEALQAPLEKFSAAVVKGALARFQARLEEKAGKLTPGPSHAEAEQMLEAALVLLTDLQKVAKGETALCMRRLTEAEAAADGALLQVRASLQGPRIILA